MSYTTNTVHNNNLYIRCPNCGDSKRRNYVAHFNISLANGLGYCYRCGYSTKLSLSQFVEITSHLDITPPKDLMDLDAYENIPVTDDERYSLLLSRYNDDEKYRQWEMRKPNGDIVGYHQRYAGKVSRNIGLRGLGYVGTSLKTINVLRVVEGAYDVVLPDSVCVFGKITSSSIRLLKHYDLCLCPDRDCFDNSQGLKMLLDTVLKHTNVLFVELLTEHDAYDFYMKFGNNRGKILSREKFIHNASKLLMKD